MGHRRLSPRTALLFKTGCVDRRTGRWTSGLWATSAGRVRPQPELSSLALQGLDTVAAKVPLTGWRVSVYHAHCSPALQDDEPDLEPRTGSGKRENWIGY